MYSLGIAAFFHDSAAAIAADGELIAAAQEERFTRIKHDASFRSAPSAIAWKKPASTRVSSIPSSFTKSRC